MLYILWGRDDFSLNQALEKIKRGIGDQAALAANTTVLDGQQTTLGQLQTVCETFPFLAEKRLVIVRGLLERFESPRRSSRQKKTTPSTNQKDEYKSLSDYVGSIPDSTVLVLIGNEITDKNPLLKALSGRAEVRFFPLLRDKELREWVQRRVAQEGGSLSPGAVDLLVRLVGGDLWTMSNEINKLVTFASGRRIEEEDIKTMVSHAQQANVFAMVDAILEFKTGVAGRLLQKLLQRGATSSYLLVMLSRQVRMMVRARELRGQGKSKTDIQSMLGLTSEFALRKTLEQADRYPLERIRVVYHRLLEADLSIKTGKYDGELALNLLIVELCQPRQAPSPRV